MFLFNPGSCGRCYTGPNTYGVMLLDKGKITSFAHHFGVQGQRLFQVAQAISQKNNGSCIAFCVQDALHCTGAVVAVAQDQKFRHGWGPPKLCFLL